MLRVVEAVRLFLQELAGHHTEPQLRDLVGSPLEHIDNIAALLTDHPQVLNQVEPTHGLSLLHAIAAYPLSEKQDELTQYENLIEKIKGIPTTLDVDFTRTTTIEPHKTAFELALWRQYDGVYTKARAWLIKKLLEKGVALLFEALRCCDVKQFEMVLAVYPPLINQLNPDTSESLMHDVLTLRYSRTYFREPEGYADFVRLMIKNPEPFFFLSDSEKKVLMEWADQNTRGLWSINDDKALNRHLKIRSQQQAVDPNHFAVLRSFKRRQLEHPVPFVPRRDLIYYQPAGPADFFQWQQETQQPLAPTTFPTDAIFAQLAQRAYDDVLASRGINASPLPAGWVVKSVFGVGQARGVVYHHCLADNQAVSTVMMAFPGEWPNCRLNEHELPASCASTSSDSNQPCKASALQYAPKAFRKFFREGLEVLERNREEHPEARFCFTGHGLGGWLAQWTMMYVKFESLLRPQGRKDPDVAVVVFNSPGGLMSRKDFFTASGASHVPPWFDDAAFYNLKLYQTEPNQLNTYGAQSVQGMMYRVYLPESDREVVTMSEEMSMIARAFDSRTGLPYECRRVIHWPGDHLDQMTLWLQSVQKTFKGVIQENKDDFKNLSPSEQLEIFFRIGVDNVALFDALKKLSDPSVASAWDKELLAADHPQASTFKVVEQGWCYETKLMPPVVEIELRHLCARDVSKLMMLDAERENINRRADVPRSTKAIVLGFYFLGERRTGRRLILTAPGYRNKVMAWLGILDNLLEAHPPLKRHWDRYLSRREREEAYAGAYLGWWLKTQAGEALQVGGPQKLYRTWLRYVFWDVKADQPLFGSSVDLGDAYIPVVVRQSQDAVDGDESTDPEIRTHMQRNLAGASDDQPVQLDTIFEREQDINPLHKLSEKNSTSVLFIGEAGSGKTMLASYLAAQWVEEKSYRDFDWMFYLSCQTMDRITKPSVGLDVSNFDRIFMEFVYWQNFSGSGLSLEDFRDSWLQYVGFGKKEKNRILVILDGLDEEPEDHPYKDLVNILLGGRSGMSLLITTRPYFADRVVKPDKTLLVEGFGPHEFERYFQKFCDDVGANSFALDKSISPEKVRDKTLEYINDRKELKSLVRSPLMLNVLLGVLLCGPVDNESPFSLKSTVGLMYQLEGALLRRAWRRKQGSDFSSESISSLRLRYQEDLKRLNKLAFLSMQGKQSLGSDVFVKEAEKKRLLELPDGPLNSGEMFYHALVKEYFSAVYIAEAFRNNNKKVLEVLARPDHPRYRMVYPMVSTLLVDDERAFKRFRRAVDSHLADELAGGAALGMAVRCIEAAGWGAESWRDSLMCAVQDKVLEVYNVNKTPIEGKKISSYIPSLIRDLKDSPGWLKLQGKNNVFAKILPENVQSKDFSIHKTTDLYAMVFITSLFFPMSRDMKIGDVYYHELLNQYLSCAEGSSFFGTLELLIMLKKQGHVALLERLLLKADDLIEKVEDLEVIKYFLLLRKILHRMTCLDLTPLDHCHLDDVRNKIIKIFRAFSKKTKQIILAYMHFSIYISAYQEAADLAEILMKNHLTLGDFARFVVPVFMEKVREPLFAPFFSKVLLKFIEKVKDDSSESFYLAGEFGSVLNNLTRASKTAKIHEAVIDSMLLCLRNMMFSKDAKLRVRAAFVLLSLESSLSANKKTVIAVSGMLKADNLSDSDETVVSHYVLPLVLLYAYTQGSVSTGHDLLKVVQEPEVLLGEKVLCYLLLLENAFNMAGALDEFDVETVLVQYLQSDDADSRVALAVVALLSERLRKAKNDSLQQLLIQADNYLAAESLLLGSSDSSAIDEALKVIDSKLSGSGMVSHGNIASRDTTEHQIIRFLGKLPRDTAKQAWPRLEKTLSARLEHDGDVIVKAVWISGVGIVSPEWILSLLHFDWKHAPSYVPGYFASCLSGTFQVCDWKLPVLLTLVCGAFHRSGFNLRLAVEKDQYVLYGDVAGQIISIPLLKQSGRWFRREQERIRETARKRDLKDFERLYQSAPSQAAGLELDNASCASTSGCEPLVRYFRKTVHAVQSSEAASGSVNMTTTSPRSSMHPVPSSPTLSSP